jgi:hypothetical protein
MNRQKIAAEAAQMGTGEYKSVCYDMKLSCRVLSVVNAIRVGFPSVRAAIAGTRICARNFSVGSGRPEAPECLA